MSRSRERVLMDSLPVSVNPWMLYTPRQRWGFLAVLFLVSTSNYLDRHIVSVLLEPIKEEFQVSDTMLGVLSGFSFAVCYTIFGMPVARWADRGNRRTVITLALVVWSIMTILCGLAQTFWQLALARVGVGAGESGAVPPAQSLVADYFPPEQRARALAILTAAATTGYLLGFGMGGYIAATYGWRNALLLAGAPGLVLALIVRLTLAEPRVQLESRNSSVPAESVRDTLAVLWSKRSFRYALIGSCVHLLFAYGALVFVPSFLIRLMHASLAEVSVTYGAVVALASLIGTLGGGWAADRLGQRDHRWLAWVPAVTYTLAAPLYILAFSVSDLGLFMAFAFAGYTLLMTGSASVFAAILAVCGSRRRAMAIALVLFSATLFGQGFGPVASGALSDALSAIYGANGLRYSLMTMVTLLLASGILFYWFGRAMSDDLEE